MSSKKARTARSADATYPSPAVIAASQGAALSLAGIQSGGFPAQATLADGDTAILVVAILKSSGKLLASGNLSYAFGTATSATWYWNVLYGAFTVNGGAPASGIYIHPTVAGGTVSPILETGALIATPAQVLCTDILLDFSATGPSPLPLGSAVAFGLQLFASGGSGTVSAGVPGGSPFRKGGLILSSRARGMRPREARAGSVHQRATLRSRLRARVVVLSSTLKARAWLLEVACGHSTARRVELRVDGTRLPPPRHVYCVACPLRRQPPFEHEEQLADFDARLAGGGDG